MAYTEIEKGLLEKLGRTDFKNIRKEELLTLSSQILDMKPEVAAQAIAQFPELAGILKSALSEYKEMVKTTIDSDDNSLNHVYDIYGKEVDNANESRMAFFNLINRALDDVSKALDDPELTPEARINLYEKQIELLKMADCKDSEIREKELEIAKMSDKKDSEKREFNWKMAGSIGTALLITLGVSYAAIGGKVNLRLPLKS